MKNEIQKQEEAGLSISERFTGKVFDEFAKAGVPNLTEYQKQLIYGYFVQIDLAIRAAEDRRIADNEWKSSKNNDPISWRTVDTSALAVSVMQYARMGIDMAQKNFLFAIPYKDNSTTVPSTNTKAYTVNLMLGYNGIIFIAEKYALEKPKAVTVELVHENDSFEAHKKDRDNKSESYTFKINAFDRGDVIGGFGYIEYDDPSKNRLVIMSKKDIEKRAPKYASAEFWGSAATGKKVTQYVDGKKQQVDTEGWYEEMCLKTLKREVYSPKNIPLDPKKIDDSYQYMQSQELRLEQMRAQEAIGEKTASVVIDMPEPDGMPEPAWKPQWQGEPVEPPVPEKAAAPAPGGQTETALEPGF